MSARLVDVGGTRLFVDDRGDADCPPLLFIHGGPGQGCYDFMRSVGDSLAARLRVIGVDQRGTLRSDPLPLAPPLSVDLLIADFEELRRELGIGKWAVLGHSAGGHYALRYAASRPEFVSAAIFDCPCWDADLAERHRLPEVARRLTERGQDADAERCLKLAAKPGRLTIDDGTRAAAQALGSHFMELFFHDPRAAADFTQLLEDSGFSEEEWQRGNSHRPLSAALYQPLLTMVRDVACRAMLARGRSDLTTTPEMVAAFCESVPGGTLRVFERSGHFAYLEEPAEYCRAVTEFVLAHCG
ncbi:MAG: alpha/beta fold hydrolase [Streptosporangiaceae bacterium]